MKKSRNVSSISEWKATYLRTEERNQQLASLRQNPEQLATYYSQSAFESITFPATKKIAPKK